MPAESNQDTATPLLPAMSIADARAAEGAGSIRFAVTLNATYHEAATANWSTSDGTATAGSDYTAVSSGTLTIAAESTSANITVTVTQDTTDEKAETFTVTLTGPSHATLSGATATGTIADDDLSTVSITARSTAVTEGSPAVFELSRGIADDGSLAVNLSSSDTGDFITAMLPTSETIPGGAMSKTLSIATVDDGVTEGDGSVTVTIQTNSRYTVGTASATVNIRDNDASYLLNLAGGGTVLEDAGTVPFTVTLSESSPTEAITVQWATADVSATASADYTAGSDTLNFAAGASGPALTQGFTVAVTDDSVHEADEQFIVELSGATGTGANINAGNVTVTISDDEVPALSIGNASANEGAGSIGFPVTLSLTSEVQITVDYATSVETADTATASDDFTPADGTLTFAPGARSRTISVTLENDAVDEDNETFTVTLKDPAAGGTGSSTPTLPSPASAQGTIVDDDGAPQLSIADAGAAESAGEIHFAVSLDLASNREVSASWSTADVTATAGSDYTAVSSGTLTIAAESTSATLTVTVAQDTDDEPSETFTVTLDTPVNGELADASATGTIEDDDPSVVTITAVSTPVTEGNPAVFELDRGIADDMDLAVTLGSSQTGAFITASLPTSATIPSGQSSTTVSIATVDDGVTEDHGSVTVTIQTGTGYTPGTPASATVAIQDDDAAFTLAIAGGGTVDEDVVSRTFTVTLSPPSAGRTPIDSITVQWATADGSATAGADYTAGSGTLSFAAGASGAALTQEFTVPVSDDGVHEADEQFTVTLSNATGTGATIDTDTATVTIEDNDVPELSIAAASANENGGSIGFPVTLSPQSEVEITVGYATSVEAGDTVPAGSGSDFTAATGTLTFMAGTTSRTIAVTLMDDTADEDNETFTVTLSGPTAAGTGSSMPTLASPGSAQGTIVDDDGLPLLSIAAASVGEGDGSIHFEVSLDPASAKDVSASWSTADGTAEAGSDYGEETGGTLTIARGTTSTTVTVTVRQDTVDEPPETFTVTLSGPVNGELSANDSATGTIEDDDLSTVSITAVSTSVTEGNPAEFAVSRGIEDDVDLAVTLSSSETGGFITAALPTSATIPSGASSTTVSIATDDNEDDDDDGSVTVTIQAEAGYAIGTASATVAIQDDDVAYRLEIAGGGTVDEGAGSATLSVTLSEASPTEPITVQWTTADGTATSPADYTAAAGALTFATAATGSALTQQLTVTIEDDNLNENDEAFTVTLSNAGGMGALIATGSATVTITDNEATPVLSIADATAAEDRRMIRFPVTLNPGSGAEVTVDYATTDGTAAAGSDFTAVTGGTLTFAPGATARMISISLIDDEVDEADETFTVTLSNASSNAELASDPAAQGTIVNDDGPVEVTVGDASCPESAENRCLVSVDVDKTVSFDVVLNLNTADGTATGGAAPGNVFAPGDDFKIRANRPDDQVDCAAGACTSPNFRIRQDQIDEEDETFTYTVTLVGTPHAVIVRGTGTVTIEDDDPPSSVSIADGSAEEDAGTISFVVSLDHESGKQIGVAWATADGTAVAGQDYQATSAVVNFAPGVTTQTISVALIDDSDREPDGESFQVTLSRAAGTDADDLALGDQGDRRDRHHQPQRPQHRPHRRADDHRHPADGGGGTGGGHQRHRRRRRPERRDVRIPVDGARRDRRNRRRRGDGGRLHAAGQRRGQDHQGAGDLHRRQRNGGNAVQRPDGDRGRRAAGSGDERHGGGRRGAVDGVLG